MRGHADISNAEVELRRLLGATAAHRFDVSTMHGIVTLQMDPTDAATLATLASMTLEGKRR